MSSWQVQSHISCGLRCFYIEYFYSTDKKTTIKTLETLCSGMTRYYSQTYIKDEKGQSHKVYKRVERPAKTVHMCFSDSDALGNGMRLEAFIKEHSLGEVVCVGPHTNQNSGHKIRTWLWAPDYPKIQGLLDTLKAEEEAKKPEKPEESQKTVAKPPGVYAAALPPDASIFEIIHHTLDAPIVIKSGRINR